MDKAEENLREQEEQSTRRRASLLGLAYLDSRRLTNFVPVPDVLDIGEMRDKKIVPLAKSQSQIDFGITINTSNQTINSFRDRFQDYNIKTLIISDAGYHDLILIYDPPKKVTFNDINIVQQDHGDNLWDVSKTLDEVSSDEALNYVIDQAVRLNASDIHMEALKTHTRLRFRIDGVLHPVAMLTHQKYYTLQSTVAIRGSISTNAPDAQTGHMSEVIKMEDGTDQNINIRIETVPTLYGQDIVMRLFVLNKDLLSIDRIGLSEKARGQIGDVLLHPHGMILVVGPTGSGKTTTLYSILNELNDPSRKIITLEDPVEYGLEGVSQIQVQSRFGDSFADKLRAVLRQDPNVIMVGEIRDADTAKTSLQASLTGHLVLSTFHADDASAALTRLFDTIGGNPMLSSSINLVVAQRLVRRLDDSTKESYEPSQEIKDRLKKELARLPDYVEMPDFSKLVLYKPGKSDDNPFGYKGRIIIMEQLKLTERVQKVLHNDGLRSLESMKKIAMEEGMLTILQDGLLKAINGLTTLEEVYKVTS